MKNNLHTLSLGELEKALGTDLSDGLSMREARERLPREKKRDGKDRYSLFVPKKSNYFALALSFFTSPGIILLILISLLATIFGNLLTGISVMLLTLAGAIVGGSVLQSSHKRLESMDDFASPMVRVKRGGNKFYTDGRNIVTGDVIVLSEGDLLPCDARIISSRALVVKELINTEAGIRNRVVSKNHSTEYTDGSIESPDAENMLYAGSAILAGEAVALVVATGREVYLAEFLPEGALGGAEGADAYAQKLKPTLYRASFIGISALAILSLLSLVTLRETSFVSNFLMLLSAVSMLSLELFKMGYENIFSAVIEKMSKSGATKKKQDVTAQLRGALTSETLSKVTRLALLGRAALYDGVAHVDGAFVSASGEILPTLDPKTPIGRRILTCVHTYLKAVRESGAEIDLVRDGISDSLGEYLKAVEFDTSGASLVLRSLYFADDASGKNGYACAETAESEYRVLLTFDDSVLSFCERIRAKDGRAIEELRLDGALSAGLKSVRNKGGRCLFVISETKGETVLEGVISLCERPAEEIALAISEMKKMSVGTTVMLLSEDKYILDEPLFADLFDGKIAIASEFKALGRKITDGKQDYCAYLGFTAEEYASLIVAMRQRREIVAAYGIDNDYYNVMSRADLNVSCDILTYSSNKYKESVYERLAGEGRDSNIRCSQMTRLLSRVLIHRSHSKGGGLLAISNATRRSRAAYLSFAYSILFFALLMSSVISMSAMSALLGIPLLNAVQVSCLSLVSAILAMTVFAGAQPKYELLYSRTDFASYPTKILGDKFIHIISRVGAVAVFAIAIKVLDALEVFGERASYSMPIFIGILLTGAIDLFVLNLDFTRSGEGRRASLTRFLIAYAVVLLVGGVITQDAFAAELFPHGIGSVEFILAPIFCVWYIGVVFAALLIEKNRKKG